MFKKIIVKLKKPYPIIIGFDIFKKNKIISYFNKKKKYVLITNPILFKIWAKNIIKYLKINNFIIDFIIIPDGERYKSLIEINNIITQLLKKEYGRDTVLIAFGGGVIGDITGFVASIYQRGIEFIQIPTTLLAQVDASIGGKTGVNHDLGKNMIGSFWQPKYVIIDLFFLSTLSKRELFSGFSEVIKYSIIFDKFFFIWLEKNFKKLILLKKKQLFYCIKKCCKLKSHVISLDEREENNFRALLNFGHTYGHAIESYTRYSKFLHGEAISIGMVIALRTSKILGLLKKNIINRVIFLLRSFNLPIYSPTNIPIFSYLKYMKRDKKNFSGKIKLILPHKIGLVKIYDNVCEKDILDAIKSSIK
ncbi:MAG: 3-dehydroquinate synthase [Buchnera aphidicola (Periphyllus lyropictus)]|uniref:3-dehydroquinate synthase n=1 Tax=Buchnera aphidicola TaxID=9 RepID=UPI001EC11101|nr:3-dehydroquinate synthase [Buchnera aphidicola]NIH16461.1 3-dehydroquinate synthase [Buchnera aphidicola (Periphyllus lyropictus)]USS94746.1 3-dehydroquinate synthase [Buchnera aphidicola (Periphyllus lyropictus)]